MVLRRHEQRLGRRQTAASPGAGATGMVAAAHRAGDRRPSRDGQRLPEGGRDRGARRGGRPRVVAAKTGHHAGGVHRPGPAKPAIPRGGVHRLGAAKPAISDGVSTDSARDRAPGRAPTASACEPYRELIAEALGRGRNAMAIWQDLVDDHGFTGARTPASAASSRQLRGDGAGRGARRHHHGARRGRPGRLRRGADGPRSASTGKYRRDAPLRPDARLLAQMRCGC